MSIENQFLNFNFDNSYERLPQQLFSREKPQRFSEPRLKVFNFHLARELGLWESDVPPNDIELLLRGDFIPPGASFIAQAYSGHQFGHYTVLGDGRALLLGEHLSPKGRLDIQLKGSGKTPYSRGGDGLATLSSMLREYLFSEALAAMKVPTTQSLAVAETGETVVREQLNRGGVLLRVAESHIRAGTFEYAARTENREILQELVNYTIDRHFPEAEEAENRVLALLEAIVKRQAELIVHWMRIGFVHGVMNTDNMQIAGETIDYGPCAFLNAYNTSTVFSSIDHWGRYAFGQQPGIALWNLSRFAETLLPLIDNDVDIGVRLANQVLAQFKPYFSSLYRKMWCRKTGLDHANPEQLRLALELPELMEKYSMDYTNTFVQLMYPELQLNEQFSADEMQQWLGQWKKSLKITDVLSDELLHKMCEHNPIYIPRNYWVEKVLIDAVESDNLKPFFDLLEHLKNTLSIGDDFKLEYMYPPKLEFDEKYRTYCGT